MPDVVGGRIIRQVLNIDAETNFRRQMHHGLYAVERAVEGAGVAHVGLHNLDARRPRPCAARMDIGAQRIHHADLVSPGKQFTHNMLADEAGAAA